MDKDEFYAEAFALLGKAKEELAPIVIIEELESIIKEKSLRPVLSREELLTLLSKMLTQVVVLCNHVMSGREPEKDYVNEKLNSYPVLDFSNQDVLDRILNILEPRYGVDLQKRSWG